MTGSSIGTNQAADHSRDFQLMLARIIHRHGKGLDLTDTIAGARDLLARKGSLSPLRDDEPEATPQQSPSPTTETDPPMSVEEAREVVVSVHPDFGSPDDYASFLREWMAPKAENEHLRALYLTKASRIEAALRTLQAAGEVR